jgi:hypothetical protein
MPRHNFPRSIQKRGVVLDNPLDGSRIPARYKGERRRVVAAGGGGCTSRRISIC